jgi:hypothetical protein
MSSQQGKVKNDRWLPREVDDQIDPMSISAKAFIDNYRAPHTDQL